MAINSMDLKRRLEGHAWVELARVDKKWPDRLVLSIKEREPVSMVNLEGELHYIDRTANVFARLEPTDNLDFPLISGLSPGERSEAQEEALREALLFIKYVKIIENEKPDVKMIL